MVFAEVKRQAGAGDLHIQRQVFTETVLPIERETEKIQIKFPGLFNREDAKNGDSGGEFHC
ncbi:hypothetical protein D3C75_1108710 [compost metagenome]